MARNRSALAFQAPMGPAARNAGMLRLRGFPGEAQSTSSTSTLAVCKGVVARGRAAMRSSAAVRSASSSSSSATESTKKTTSGISAGVAKVGSVAVQAEEWTDSLRALCSQAGGIPSIDSSTEQDRKTQALQKLSTQKFPTRRDESWRHTPLTSLLRMRFSDPAAPLASAAVANSAKVSEMCTGDSGENAPFRIVLQNGEISSSLCDDLESLPNGVHIGPLRSAPQHVQEAAEEVLVDRLSLEPASHFFSSAHATMLMDRIVVFVPQGVELDRVLHVLCVAAPTEPNASVAQTSAPSFVYVLEPQSTARIVETHVCLAASGEDAGSASGGGDSDGGGRGGLFENSQSMVRLGEGAVLEHGLVSELSESSVHFGLASVQALADSRYSATTVSVGAQVSRWDVRVDLDGGGAHGEVYGLSIGDQARVSDLHSKLNHNVPGCTSDQLQKNIALARGRTVFCGHVLVDWGARNSESAQLCRSLLLSSDARVDAMPVLVINNQDVVATHGATITDLSEEELFYLRSRGLSADESKYLLVSGFGNEILQRIPLKSASKRVSHALQGIVDRIATQVYSMSEFSSV